MNQRGMESVVVDGGRAIIYHEEKRCLISVAKLMTINIPNQHLNDSLWG